MRPALVHDYLVQMGGAERCLGLLAEMFPEAPIYTGIVDEARLPSGLKTRTIHASFLQRVPLPRRLYRSYLSIYPVAFETLDLGTHDLVISSSSAFAKGVVTPPETCHICYCYTPMRFAWNAHEFARHELRGPVARALFPFVVGRLRQWDRLSADRVDEYIAISHVVAQRIRKFYRRTASAVIYPPVETAAFRPMSAPEREAVAGGDRDSYLIVSRLAPYKRIDLAIQAFNQLGRPLAIVGAGRDASRLRRMAGPNIRFLGRVSDAEVRERLAACRALIWPGEEDFGLVPVEAMAAGRPVVAYGAGGALETVVDGVTGLLFTPQTPNALAAAVLRAEQMRWDAPRLRARAEEFDVAVFRSQFRAFVEAAYARHQDRLARVKRHGSSPAIGSLDATRPGDGAVAPSSRVAGVVGGARREA